MIRVTIELVRHGDERQRRTLHVGEIWNLGRAKGSTPEAGAYGFRLLDKGGRVWRSGTFKGFPRKRRLAWDLLAWALLHAGLAHRYTEDCIDDEVPG